MHDGENVEEHDEITDSEFEKSDEEEVYVLRMTLPRIGMGFMILETESMCPLLLKIIMT